MIFGLTPTQAVELGFFGTLAALALWSTYCDEDLRWIGWALVVGFLMSNLLFFSAPLTVRPGPYTLIELMVALASYCAWASRRYRALIAVVAVNLISIGLNIYFAAGGPHPDEGRSFTFALGTNICFSVECLLVTWIGVDHGYCVGRFRRRLRLGRFSLQSNAARDSGPWT